MKAHVQQQETLFLIKEAVTVFEDQTVKMDAKWEAIILRIANEQLAKAWFPWTKRYWKRRIASENLIKAGGTYYNSPRYYYWTEECLSKAQAMLRKYSYAKNQTKANKIVLEDAELNFLSSAVVKAKMLLADDPNIA